MTVIRDIRYYVNFQSDSGLELSMLLNANSPALNGGVGGWEVIDRPKRQGLTRFKGYNPKRQDIPVMFDGFENLSSVEPDISVLLDMATSPDNGVAPPIITVTGLAVAKDIPWVIESIDWDNAATMWDWQGGEAVRLRQTAVVHLLEYVDEVVLITKSSPAATNKRSKQPPHIVQGDGQTWKQIAQIVYHNASLWWTIQQYAPNQLRGLPADNRTKITAGTIIYIPLRTDLGITVPPTYKVA